MTTKYRLMRPDEEVQKGDEFYFLDAWRLSGNYRTGVQDEFTQYRRPVGKPFVPEWRHPEAPGVPIHVTWAETPVGTPTVASSAAAAKPEPSKWIPEPGEGYRLLERTELIAEGDEFYGYGTQIWGGRWTTVTTSVGGRANLWNYVAFRRKFPGDGYRLVLPGELIETGDEWYEGGERWRKTGLSAVHNIPYSATCKPLRRKIKPAPKYRPYADADEAARALEGKLIKVNDLSYFHAVYGVQDRSINVAMASRSIPFAELAADWVFTDGTPCGVLVTE